MRRYLILIGSQLADIRNIATSRPSEWSIAFEAPGALVLVEARPSRQGVGTHDLHPLQHGRGIVLGRLFDRLGHAMRQPGASLDRDETRRIVATAGQHLVDHYWGAYVAVVCDEAQRQYHVLRDPLGGVPCYHTSYNGIEMFFSHAEDSVRFLPRDVRVNHRYLSRWLLFNGIKSRDCGLEGVDDVHGGERVTCSDGRITRAVLWNPARIAADVRSDAPAEAARSLRAAVQDAVDAWASCYDVITHKLSGGLDSSIVAGCLAQAPSRPDVNYLNFSFDVGLDREPLHLPGIDTRSAGKIRTFTTHGDERHLARLVAHRWQRPLIERQRNPAMDLSRLWRVSQSVRPSLYFTAMEIDDAELELAQQDGVQAFFSGQAGDSLFMATLQPFPAIDYGYLHGLRSGLWNHVLAATRLSKDSLWGVLGKTFRHGVLRRPYRPSLTIWQLPHLLRQERVGDVTADDFYPPADGFAALPPGKQNHVSGVDAAAYHDFIFNSGRYADHVDPLNSQPVWEVMLRFPSYTILADGISRGLARQAFADLLPPEIRTRQAKGIGTPFYQQVVRGNRELLREWLSDGMLVREGYLDARKLRECLDKDAAFVGVSASQILNYLAAEIWLQHWSSLSQGTQRHVA